MKIEDVKADVETYLKKCDDVCAITKTAFRNRKSLSGNNPYGYRFHTAVVEMTAIENRLTKILTNINVDGEPAGFITLAEIMKSPTAKHSTKVNAAKQIALSWRSQHLPALDGMTADLVPETEQVLPAAVVENTRGYIERVVLQANGCYEHQWYDACAVMIRRLVETLIIHVYEHARRQSEIQDSTGNYKMLRDLVDKIVGDTSWNLGRETKAVLPLLKSLGDRSAHNRTYLAKKIDIDKVLPGLRVLADEFLHLAGLK